jgi:hypothetical protein
MRFGEKERDHNLEFSEVSWNLVTTSCVGAVCLRRWGRPVHLTAELWARSRVLHIVDGAGERVRLEQVQRDNVRDDLSGYAPPASAARAARRASAPRRRHSRKPSPSQLLGKFYTAANIVVNKGLFLSCKVLHITLEKLPTCMVPSTSEWLTTCPAWRVRRHLQTPRKATKERIHLSNRESRTGSNPSWCDGVPQAARAHLRCLERRLAVVPRVPYPPQRRDLRRDGCWSV